MVSDGLLACQECGKRWVILFWDSEKKKDLGPCCMPPERRGPILPKPGEGHSRNRDWNWPIGKSY